MHVLEGRAQLHNAQAEQAQAQAQAADCFHFPALCLSLLRIKPQSQLQAGERALTTHVFASIAHFCCVLWQWILLLLRQGTVSSVTPAKYPTQRLRNRGGFSKRASTDWKLSWGGK
jgi:hypothetical protein